MRLRPKKKLGQNFLKNRKVLSFISSCVSNCSSVLEIGGGDGRLTNLLTENKGYVYVVEVDNELCQKLFELFNNRENIKVICNDFLKVEAFPVSCIVGNIPYYLSSKILFKLVEWNFEKALLMFQKEFAEKMVSSPGNSNYGRLSVTSQYYFEVKILRIVSRKDFFPSPKVDSAIVEIRKKREKNQDFDEIVRRLYSLKNKKIRNIIGVDVKGYAEKRPRHLSVMDIINILRILKES